MKLLKKINNNFALALDSKGEQIIVEGKGIGFQKMPCEISDYKLITRTYYDFDQRYIEMLNEIPMEIMDIANELFEHIMSGIGCSINPNLPFILADHIDFAIKRMKKNIVLKLPMYYDLMQMYPYECEMAEYALKLIKVRLGVRLAPEEKSGIVLNIINAEMNCREMKRVDALNEWIDRFVEIIEDCMHISISRDTFNFTRFATHVNYLYKRVEEGTDAILNDEGGKLYRSVKEEIPEISTCIDKIVGYLEQEENVKLTEEEKLYLMLHVNRLCSRD